MRALVALLAGTALVAAACADASPAGAPDATEIPYVTPPPPTTPPVTTTTTLGRPPVLDVASRLDVVLDVLGHRHGGATLEVEVSDPDGGPVTVEVEGPTDLVAIGANRWVWQPMEPTLARATLVATDETGRQATAEVELRARYPARAAVVALGDSVPSGQGLDLLDYLRGDPCFRAEGDGYPRRVRDLLVARSMLPADADLAVVACSGADVADLVSEPVDGGLAGTSPEDVRELPQLEWAVRANPAVVTLTVGANDLGFVFPGRLIDANGIPERDRVEPRLEDLRNGLDRVLQTLVERTDATVALTNYYNPSAARPQGVDGCEELCFRDVADDLLAELNAAIADAAVPYGDRVVLVDLSQPFATHGAPNGFGPDGARAGLGVLGDVLGPIFEGTQPYCAKGEGGPEPWVSSLDCVHPNQEGAAAIAAAIVAAIST